MSMRMGEMSRRGLLRSASSFGAALVIAFEIPREAKGEPAKPPFGPVRAWIRIDSVGTVTLFYHKSEMGQGISTALPMVLAEELGLDWKNVNVEHADLDPDHQNQGTGGSGSVASTFMQMRKAGAAAREMLVAAAAKRWGVSPENCTARDGAVWRENDKISYGELVESASQLPAPDFDTVRLKRPQEFTVIGKSLARKDIPSKTDGSAVFGLDVRVPGMVYASIERCPVFGGKVKSFDAANAKAMKGVLDVFAIEADREVHSTGGVAVVAETTYIALQARKRLRVDWDYGPHANESSETLRKQFRRLVDSQMKVVLEQGDTEAAMASAPASKRIECDYELGFQAHATMEPMNCTVHIQPDRAEAWVPTQAPEWAAQMISKASGLSPDKIVLHTTYMGGGFGRRYQADFALEGAQIAKRTGRPVQVVWSREDDMTHDFYRPASYHRVSGAVDEAANITAWRHKSTSTSIAQYWRDNAPPESSELGSSVQNPYAPRSYKLEYLPADSGVPRAWWRSVEASQIGFVMESFIDELAHGAGADPYEFRIRALGNARKIRNPLDEKSTPLDTARFGGVLRLAAEKSGWGTPLPPGHGRGIAAHFSFNSYVANVVEISIISGRLRVERITSAVDIGIAVNPAGVRAQVESAIIYGLTAALKSEITIENGRAVETNFNKFTTLTMKETPPIDVHIVSSTADPTGIGEPALPPTAPALTNAIFALTRKRIRRLPIKPADLA
ncbi:MAG: xanthine dehydrogenase family protein molybdopterin-binding subunit [Acidobacteriaceae bacterium]|nr:xanthine dehydrogenase family protein molybdopterin-binding subunit [Acidobacteriaceae bacterium]